MKMCIGGKQITRGLAQLICQAFVPMPKNRIDTPTPIHLDGDFKNCRADNLAWRPRWFAQRHTAQFRQNLENPNPVFNVDTGAIYDCVWDAVFAEGLLFNDIIKSIVNKTYVFPSYHRFEWLNPD